MSSQILNPGVEMPHLDGISHRWVEVRGERFHVAKSTSADPAAPVVVLVHGWPQHWWCWRKVIPELVPDTRVVALDLRGHGWSSAPERGYRKEELVDDLIAVLDELGHDRVTLVGHDWGGWVGFLAALRHPERFDALVALGGGCLVWFGLVGHANQVPTRGRSQTSWSGRVREGGLAPSYRLRVSPARSS